ncbi:hypothetical protein IFM89_002619 [Coptis chinensis]|uniref:RING-type domain-containing protein n=1 Tax=Coptis chinensis TaxID=261450 RepID=A0A835L9V0_9MAGN|nr:hypothetical protein IFM89_002619 [Coptis chinensis]
MAIEAHQLNYFPSHQQIIHTREIINNFENKAANMEYGLSGMSGDQTFIPFYNSALVNMVPETMETTTTMKAESGVTYNNNLCSSSGARKRSRDSFAISINNPLMDLSGSRKLCRNNTATTFSFLGEDISLQIQQQQLEMDYMIAQHMEKVRLMIVETRKEHTRRLTRVIEERMMKSLREKEAEIERTVKYNWLLEERIKTVCLENIMWRNLAETNEATANALQSNLEQVLSHKQQVNNEELDGVAEDAQSCCGSSDFGGEGAGKEKSCGTSGRNSSRRWWCRKCGEEESSVVLLPCRHLCLCTFCAPTIHKCPICDSNKNGSVHVNMS